MSAEKILTCDMYVASEVNGKVIREKVAIIEGYLTFLSKEVVEDIKAYIRLIPFIKYIELRFTNCNRNPTIVMRPTNIIHFPG